ncbi:hypothetical protein [uncultured Sphingomonas sp.]|uniref:hypothetical protein n=1 Tax=uncultured Sphingomonas sp. TaxID=158754 RepID=UPI0035CB6669
MARILPLDHEARHTAFLRALAVHGNERRAARSVGIPRSTLQARRDADYAFALRWAKALTRAAARLAAEAVVAEAREDNRSGGKGGRTMIVRLAKGRVLRRARPPRTFTRPREQAFLLALSACANVRLAAAAAGVTATTIYQRRRASAPFAREMRLALAHGYDEIEAAMLEVGLQSGVDGMGDWRLNDRPAIPAMTAGQALQLLYLHQKEARLGGTPEPLRNRRGETSEMRSLRFQLMIEHRDEQAREQFRAAEIARRARGEPLFLPQLEHELPPITSALLSDLSQVTGWSEANPASVPRDPDVALFGGHRVKHLTKEQIEKGRAAREDAAWERRLLRGE